MIQIIDKNTCCGCAACIQKCPKQCIDLVEDFEGFLYPKVNQNLCIDCGLCEKVCPIINQGTEREPLQVYAAKNKDEKIRMESSSGGIFSLLAEEVLRDNGVVFGAKFNANWEVVHAYTETCEGLAAFRGSKYVQSRVGDTFKQAEIFLKQGRKVLYSGTPCQIAGLKLFLRKEYENLLTIDFICHGVPSPKVFDRYINELITHKNIIEKNAIPPYHSKKDIIKSISFRNKALGWRKFSFTFTFFNKEDKKNPIAFSEPLNKNLFMRGFLADLYLRPSCYACPAKCFKSGSDITIADFWGIQNVSINFDDDKGVSSIMVNTKEKSDLIHSLDLLITKTTYQQAKQRIIEYSAKQPIFLRWLFFHYYESFTLYILIMTLSSIFWWKRNLRLKTIVFLNKIKLTDTIKTILKKK